MLKKLLRDGEVDQRRVDVFVAEVCGQVREARLRIDPLSIPSQHAVEHKGVPEVVNARAYLAVLRLDPGTSKHADQQLAGHHLRVSSGRLRMPEQGSGRFAGRARLFTSVEVGPKSGGGAIGERQPARLEKLGPRDINSSVFHVHIAHV